MIEPALVMIPARMASTRLPGKPLAMIAGLPMIMHVWQRAMAADIGPVVVAVSEGEVAEPLKAAGACVVMTDPALPSGTDRIAAALAQYDPLRQYKLVVNLQGDLPTLDPGLISKVLEPFAHPGVQMATLVTPITREEEASNPSVVKAVVEFPPPAYGQGGKGRIGRALYFSRHIVPAGAGPLYHHIGLYAYRRKALEAFVALPPSMLELRESLEQLRALAAGFWLAAVEVDTLPLGVDTPEDLARARQILTKL
jgi:3-deoxy-manno-octulosonate cytidylyltransferase (CMP-KDO synthetase)